MISIQLICVASALSTPKLSNSLNQHQRIINAAILCQASAYDLFDIALHTYIVAYIRRRIAIVQRFYVQREWEWQSAKEQCLAYSRRGSNLRGQKSIKGSTYCRRLPLLH